MKNPGLEELRELLSDDKLIMSLGAVTAIELAKDRSVLRLQVNIIPDNLEIVCRMSWELTGPEAGLFQFPSINDLVLVAYIDGDVDQAFVVKRLTSAEDKIPLKATEGHTVLRSLAGKKAFITSDQEIHLTRGDNEATERSILGDIFKAAYSAHLALDAAHTHVGNMGFPTAPPQQAADYQNIKAGPVDDDAMLSDLVKLEK